MNKYEYLYVIQGNYGSYGWEDVSATENIIEAFQLLKDYRENEGNIAIFRRIQRRVLKEKTHEK